MKRVVAIYEVEDNADDVARLIDLLKAIDPRVLNVYEMPGDFEPAR